MTDLEQTVSNAVICSLMSASLKAPDATATCQGVIVGNTGTPMLKKPLVVERRWQRKGMNNID